MLSCHNIPIAPPYIKVFSLAWKNEGAQLPHHLGVADSLGWGCVATFNARAGLCHWPFAITCQATPIVPDAGQFIRLTHTPALSVGGTYSSGRLLTVFGDSRNIIVGVGAILFCYFHLPTLSRFELFILVFLLRMIR